jgi:hypothetical protein
MSRRTIRFASALPEASRHPKWGPDSQTQDGTFGPLFATAQKGGPKVPGLAALALRGQARAGLRKTAPTY